MATSACVLALAGPAMPALAWQVATRWNAAIEVEDNPALAEAGGDTTAAAALGGRVDVSSESAAAATRLGLGATLRARRGGVDDGQAQGVLSLAQTWAGERHGLSATVGLVSDSTGDAEVGSVDTLLGQGGRRSRSAALSGEYRVSPRLAAQAGLSHARTDYDERLVGATDFTQTGVSATLSYRLSERDSASLQWSRSAYRAPDAFQETDSDSWQIGLSRALSETSSGSIGAGRYTSRRRFEVLRLACPLPIEYCQSALVSYQLVPLTLNARAAGSNFSLRWDWQFDEVSALGLRATRELSSGGSGVLRNDSVVAQMTRRLTPTLSLALTLDQTQARTPEAAAATSTRLRRLILGLSSQLATDVSVQLGLDHRRLEDYGRPAQAHSTRLSASVQVTGRASSL